MNTKLKPMICGVSGTSLTNEERKFYSNLNPLGFSIFKKNIVSKEQISNLCKDLKDLTGRQDTPILIDQEGGPVYRLKSPIWRQFPSQLDLGKFAYSNVDRALEKTVRLVYLNAKLIACELNEIGINANCAPVADLLSQTAHHITSTRSFGINPSITSSLVNSVVDGLLECGIQPIVKHIPGQGRSNFDSHQNLPTVKTTLRELEKTDFLVFKNIKNAKWGMTAHIKYNSIDPTQPATYSSKVLRYIKNNIGFNGILITDCLTMKALPESYGEKASKAIKSGHDLVFFGGCSHEILTDIANNLPNLSEESIKRISNSFQMKPINQNISKIISEYQKLLTSMENEFRKSITSNISEDLKLILNTIKQRNHSDADYSSPLYHA